MNEKLCTPWQLGTYDPRVIFDRNGLEVVTVNRHYDEALPMANLIVVAPDMYDELANASGAAAEMADMMMRNGFVIDNLDDRWQKLAFTLYSRIVSMSSRAAAIVAEADDTAVPQEERC